MKKKTIVLFLFSFGILGALIYFSDPVKIWAVLSNANLLFISLGLFLWVLNSLIRTLRWDILLKKLNIRIKFFEVWQIFVASMFISNLSPAKTGDPIRSVILKKTDNKSFSKSLPSVVVERILDFMVLIIIAIISSGFLALKIQNLSIWLYLSILFYVVVISVGLFVVSSERRTEIFFAKVFKVFSFIPVVRNYENKVKEASKKFHKSFREYKHAPTILIATLLSFAVWIMEGLIIFVAFRSIGVSISLIPCIAILPLSILLGILTFLPGSIGSSELITVTFFTTLFGVALSDVTAVTIITRFLSYWPYVFVGAALFSHKFK